MFTGDIEDLTPILYRIKGFNSLVFDKNGLDKLTMAITPKEDGLVSAEKVDEAYGKGLNDAWELAKKIDEKLPNENWEIFNFGYCTEIFQRLTPQEAFAKLEAYESEQEIKVGDVVTTVNGTCEYIVTCIQPPNTLHVVNSRSGYTQQMRIDVVKKTNKHIDIASILKQIGGGKDE